MNSLSDECSDISSLVSSNKVSILRQRCEETDEITATSLEPYHFEPIDPNASDTDEDESSDEEPVGKFPYDMNWYDYSM